MPQVDKLTFAPQDKNKVAMDQLRKCHGILVPGGFGDRGVIGKVRATVKTPVAGVRSLFARQRLSTRDPRPWTLMRGNCRYARAGSRARRRSPSSESASACRLPPHPNPEALTEIANFTLYIAHKERFHLTSGVPIAVCGARHRAQLLLLYYSQA